MKPKPSTATEDAFSYYNERYFGRRNPKGPHLSPDAFCSALRIAACWQAEKFEAGTDLWKEASVEHLCSN